MKKSLTLVAFLVAAGLLLSGCATLVSGTQQKVSISADQPKAHFTIKDKVGTVVFDGTDPGTLLLSRNSTYSVVIELDGYAKQTIMVSQGINGWFWGNCCNLTGFVGWGIDFLTGAMWELKPNAVSVKLKTAMSKTVDGFVVTFYTRDDNGDLRSLAVNMTKI